jgi:CheY-like chemotaxis protein
LVVDDTESVADFMRELLVMFEHNVEVCHGVDDALARYDAGKFDLVITDYRMPGMNGVEFARALRQKSADQLILLITGSSFHWEEISRSALPFNSTLPKPFTIPEFQQALDGIFSNQPSPAATPGAGWHEPPRSRL